MARFLFTQFQNVELIVENGNPIGGAVVETMVWINSLHENGHEIDQFKYANDKRVKLSNYGFIKLFRFIIQPKVLDGLDGHYTDSQTYTKR